MKTRTLFFANSLALAFMFLIVSCQKELSFEIPPLIIDNDSTAAVFTFGSEGNNCTGAKLEGTYMAGIIMNASNTAEIEVKVAAKGVYIITTDTVNGISFYARGDFEKTGSQKIILTASGTPGSVGEKKFTIKGAGNKCSFNTQFAPKAPPAVFTFSGAPNDCIEPVIKGSYKAGTKLSTANTLTVKVNVTRAGSYEIATTASNGISFSGSGLFTAAGNNIPVVLTGIGTPIDKGVAVIRTNVDAGCKVTITIADAPPVGSGVFNCKIDGKLINFTDIAKASTKEPVSGDPYLMLGGYEENNTDSYLHLYITNTDKKPVKAGTYDEKHGIPTSLTDWGYRLEADYIVKNADLSTTHWNTSSNIIPGTNNPPFTIKITSITATRVKGTFSGKLSDLQDPTKLKTVTEGVFDLPIEE